MTPSDEIPTKEFRRKQVARDFCFEAYKDRKIKRELARSEYMVSYKGELTEPFWARDLLRNEAAALDFISTHTTIPVPAHRLYEKDGLLHLETSRPENGITLSDLNSWLGQRAVNFVEEQLEDDIIPQLQALYRNTIGSVDTSLPLIPPVRVYRYDRHEWPRITSDTDSFVFCHTNLSADNIIIDTHTYEILQITDWDFAGFYPSWFELPLWYISHPKDHTPIYKMAAPRELEFFGMTLDDLKNRSTMKKLLRDPSEENPLPEENHLGFHMV